jgi:hypothetical protein
VLETHLKGQWEYYWMVLGEAKLRRSKALEPAKLYHLKALEVVEPQHLKELVVKTAPEAKMAQEVGKELRLTHQQGVLGPRLPAPQMCVSESDRQTRGWLRM